MICLQEFQSPYRRGTKLQMRFDGPFEISQKLEPATYRLHMPASYGIHPILNIAHLEKYMVSDPSFGSRPSKSLHRDDFVALPEYEVETIVNERWCKSKNGRRVQELLTRFIGYDAVTMLCAYAPAASDRAFWNSLDWSRLSGTLGAPIFLSDRPSTRYM